ncbi:MAG: hypothetical protein BWY65_02143 [Firmicutes bacterium ADurb.Bin373]|nr:MAG: hypothetical protein BWY65_02143 [Firmicutes bacterium ADurb.Bin373]
MLTLVTASTISVNLSIVVLVALLISSQTPLKLFSILWLKSSTSIRCITLISSVVGSATASIILFRSPANLPQSPLNAAASQRASSLPSLTAWTMSLVSLINLSRVSLIWSAFWLANPPLPGSLSMIVEKSPSA